MAIGLVSQTTPSTPQHCITYWHAERGSGGYAHSTCAISRICRDQWEVCAVKLWCALSGKMLAYHILLRYWMGVEWVLLRKAALWLGYESLKAEQELAITSFVRGNDVFVSLLASLFALLYFHQFLLKGVEKASIVLVISPLISIITDQVASFCAKEFQHVW